MKTFTKMIGFAGLVGLSMAVACGSDSNNNTPTPGGTAGSAGTGTAGKGGSSGSSGTAGSGTSGGGTGGATAGNGGTAGATAGNGGSSGAGTSGTGGEAGATSVIDKNPYTNDGGYYKATMIMGYPYGNKDSKGSTLSPADFSAVKKGDALCIMGSVVAETDYSGYAQLGFNAGMPASGVDGGSPMNTPVKGGTGIKVTVDNIGGSPLRLNVHGGDGKDYCVAITGTGSSFLWSDIKQTCYGTPGAAMDATIGVDQIAVFVPGGNTNATAYDFCVTDLDITP